MRRILVFGWLGPAMSFLVIAALTASGGSHQFQQRQFFLPIVYNVALISSRSGVRGSTIIWPIAASPAMIAGIIALGGRGIHV
ncbi:hypothetical protein QA645_40635 [Bradyrhizobium sp. CIAT3101]|uniref:hypothetical protein n=1 Tax=Bradyrhizobium sp. CIAT3101 TaxID=439387 RepID=UPI0024B1D60D|nr:hypothetical protein [Bradyrhizobium sp. CIAT3101]WFU80667.1 hypothetical protein QA645_40635 [Bradyrhizobium sp. CIAT3101]